MLLNPSPDRETEAQGSSNFLPGEAWISSSMQLGCPRGSLGAEVGGQQEG